MRGALGALTKGSSNQCMGPGRLPRGDGLLNQNLKCELAVSCGRKALQAKHGDGQMGGALGPRGALRAGGTESHLAQLEPEVLEERSGKGEGQKNQLGPVSILDCNLSSRWEVLKENNGLLPLGAPFLAQ